MRLPLILLLSLPVVLFGQSVKLLSNSHQPGGHSQFNPLLQPFYHGVASGDPLRDRVIIWTRVTPDSLSGYSTIPVNWKVATDTAMQSIVQSGAAATDSSSDFTVKIDVSGLQAGTTYYYQFEQAGRLSLVGRTRTLAIGQVNRLKFGVVSCNNYEAGYFNAFEKLAERNDLNAVLHLGDYIYEYRGGQYGDSTTQRFVQPFETVNLAQYRARYSLYRLDDDLRRAHQQHPFINIWDDHESANDSWENGAQNHQPSEGLWSDRKAASKKAFFEWLPIRENATNKIYRSFEFGQLAELIMLDTRLEGRMEQENDVTQPALYDSSRTILGTVQRDWFTSELSASTAKWRLIGNQVLFAPLQLGWSGPYVGQTPEQVESQFLDIWDGYPAERQRIITHLDTAGISNTVFLTGDFHSSFAFDIADTVVDDNNNYAPVGNYDPQTGAGSVAVEFAPPSITSANFDENSSVGLANFFESLINSTLPAPINNNPNPHMKYTDLDRHGYIVLDVRPDSVKANWYYVTSILDSVAGENFGAAWQTVDGENHLKVARQSSPGTMLVPAPEEPFLASIDFPVEPMVAFSVYPNPAGEKLFIQIGNQANVEWSCQLIDTSGRLIKDLGSFQTQIGVNEIQLELGGISRGSYLLQIVSGENSKAYPVFIR